MKATQNRMTKQRRVILEELRGVSSHPTTEELHAMVRERMPHVSLGTVYRNLDLLTASGEIRQINSGGAVRRFDGNCSVHCHVRCLTCGRVGDVALEHPPHSVAQVRAEGFFIVASRIEFDGVCSDCSTKTSPACHTSATLSA